MSSTIWRPFRPCPNGLIYNITLIKIVSWAPSQYPKRRLSVRSRKVSKPRDLYLELFDRSEIWQALRQQCCRCACQISKRYDSLKYQSRGFETLRDLTKRRLFGYWDGSQIELRGVQTNSFHVPCSCVFKLQGVTSNNYLWNTNIPQSPGACIT